LFKQIENQIYSEIKKGERVFQISFQPFLTTDDDNASGKRTGGMGSTGI
jgi:dUTP pyrophosphatase